MDTKKVHKIAAKVSLNCTCYFTALWKSMCNSRSRFILRYKHVHPV